MEGRGQREMRIGECAGIAAGSVVTNDVPAYTLCGGPRIRAYAQVTVPLTVDTEYAEFVRGLRPLGRVTAEPGSQPRER